MLRVTRTNDGATIRLEGRLTKRDLGAIREARGEVGEESLSFDLGGLTFVDEEGALALAEMARRGARLSRASGFVRTLLEKVTP